MRIDGARIIGWAIPLACIAVSIVTITRARARLVTATRELGEAQVAVGTATVARDKAEKESGTMRIAAVPADKDEESLFLDGVRGYAAKNHLAIAKWASQLPEPLAPKQADGSQSSGDDSGIDPTIKSLVRIRGEVTLDGSYQGVRTFLRKLAKSSRLYTISNIHWVRKDTGVEVTASVARYVDPTLTAADIATRNQ